MSNAQRSAAWLARFWTKLWAGWGLIFALVIVVGFGLRLRPTDSRGGQLTITAGSQRGLRHSIANAIREFAAQSRLQLDLVATTGSHDSLARVETGEIGLALTQGALAGHRYRNIRQVAVLHIEPLHLLVQSELWPETSRRLSTLRGSEINVSTPGSGTNALAVDMLRFVGLHEGDYQATHLSYDQLMSANTATADLPDAVFTVSSLPSPLAKHLISRHGFRLVDLPIANAFKLDWRPRPKQTQHTRVVRRRITATQIPAFTYQVDPHRPEQTVQTLGTRLNLVAHVDIPAEDIERLVGVIYQTSFATISEPPLSLDLLTSSPEFVLHTGAERYVKKKTPIITEEVIEVTEQTLAIVGAVCGGLLFVWQAVVYVRRRRRDRQFLACIERVAEIETRALQFDRDDSMTVHDLARLQDELKQIKLEMVEQFQRGDIEGAETLSGFLMHVNDANENLTRMILHERAPRPVPSANDDARPTTT